MKIDVYSNMDELSKLAYKYGTDKCSKISHGYTPYYYDLFKNGRKRIKKVLEIGIGSKILRKHLPKNIDKKLWLTWKDQGASLYMWRDFFPNAQIYGADNLPELLFQDERIETFLCDQGDKNDLKKLIYNTGGDIDVFIDDGSHNQRHQFNTCLTLMPLLKKDVIYIIEDVGVARNIIRNIGDHYDYQEVKFGGRRDNRLMIVKHK